jgi:hypothetical protein
VAVTAAIGAAAGAVFGFLYLTEQGRRIRAEIEPRIDEFVGEVRSLRGTVEKAKAAAQESWQSIADMSAPAGSWEPSKGSRQH